MSKPSSEDRSLTPRYAAGGPSWGNLVRHKGLGPTKIHQVTFSRCDAWPGCDKSTLEFSMDIDRETSDEGCSSGCRPDFEEGEPIRLSVWIWNGTFPGESDTEASGIDRLPDMYLVLSQRDLPAMRRGIIWIVVAIKSFSASFIRSNSASFSRILASIFSIILS